jgi:predicted RNA-binding Zn ribbon-like protein
MTTHAHDEPAEERDGFSFRGGHPALDLAATLGGRLGTAPRDLLAVPQDLSRWLKASGLAQSATPATQDDLKTARNLREAIYALVLARAQDAPLPAAPRAQLNRLAGGPGATVRLDSNGALRLQGPVHAFLATIAQDALRLLAAPGRLRQCEAQMCSRLFIDLSRGGDRRWCSMTACGNRAKVAEFRRRKRAQAK